MGKRRAFTLVEAGFSVAAVSLVVCMVAGSMPAQPEPNKGPASQPEAQPGNQREEKGRERPRRARDEERPKAEPREGNEAVPLVSALARARASARQIKCSTQVRGIHQGLVMFAQNNNGSYPLPSLLDRDNATIKATPHEKDTTSNIISVMIFNGFFGPELCVSPAEVSKSINQMKNYAYSNPGDATKPAQALWDPAFNADFTRSGGGHFSYAHIMPSKSRRHLWSNSFSATEAAVGNRGPRIEALQRVNDKDVPVLPEKSNTFRIHGEPTTWEGNVAFNDNHVEYLTELYGAGVYLDPEKVKKPDCLFYDENDDPADSNLVLGIYTRSGHTTDHFKGIWD